MIKRMALTRVFDAPISVVWKYWSEPEKIMKWWGPEGFTTGCRMDFREGGTSLVCMRSSVYGRHLVYSIWAYKKIVPEKEIEFVMAFADKDGKKLDPSTLGLPAGMPQGVRHAVTFRAVDGKTEVTVKECGCAPEQVTEKILSWAASAPGQTTG